MHANIYYISAIVTLTEMVADYKQRNIFVAFVKLREHLRGAFDHCGIIELLGKTWYIPICACAC